MRALPVQLMASGITIKTCTEMAKAKQFAYAGLQWKGSCFAGNFLGYTKVADSECNTPCEENSAQACGGAWRNSVYSTK